MCLKSFFLQNEYRIPGYGKSLKSLSPKVPLVMVSVRFILLSLFYVEVYREKVVTPVKRSSNRSSGTFFFSDPLTLISSLDWN